MSFRLFIYYCAICGGWAALAGWALGRTLAPSGGVEESAIKGLFLGLAVALGVGLVDAVAVASWRQPREVLLRVLLAVVVGCLGGWLGGTAGEHFYSQMTDSTAKSAALIAGWTITGLLIGAAVSTFDLVAAFARLQDGYGARRKLRNGVLGGVVGGAVGGGLSLLIKGARLPFFEDKDPFALWSPTALGFIVLGLAIGFLIGLAQVLLREAWVRVEAGFRAVRELILSKSEVTIGRAESCDIGLFGDAGVEKLHARIVRRDTGYFLDDAGTPGGTFLNDVRIARATPIRSGDAIRVGKSVLRFGERVKKKGA